MRETPTTEVSAAEAREHLIAFVGEMAADLPHVRQRENALLLRARTRRTRRPQEPAAHALSAGRGCRSLLVSHALALLVVHPSTFPGS